MRLIKSAPGPGTAVVAGRLSEEGVGGALEYEQVQLLPGLEVHHGVGQVDVLEADPVALQNLLDESNRGVNVIITIFGDFAPKSGVLKKQCCEHFFCQIAISFSPIFRR
jgi:hypothetical protein